MGTKKPHEVTEAYLNNWLTSYSGNKGVWYFDIKQQKIRFSSGKKPFSFATENYLYIPKINGQREEGAEKWLANAEGAFVDFINRIANCDFSRPITDVEINRVVIAAVSLSCRSGYEIKLLKKQILEDPRFKQSYGVKHEDDAHRKAVENMINLIHKRVKTYETGDIQVCYGLPEPLLVCDRPAFDATEHGFKGAFMPLNPNAILQLKAIHNEKHVHEIKYFEIPNDESGLCKTMNLFTIKQARKWVVAKTKEELETISTLLSLSEVKKRIDTDKTIYRPPEQNGQRVWWKLKE